MAEQNSFTGARLTDVVNEDIHSLLAKIIKFRTQLITRPEFKSQSGWDTALNNYMTKELEKLSKQLALATVKVDTRTQDELEAEAALNAGTLADSYANAAVTAYAQDNILGSSRAPIPVVHDLTGADPNIPQVTVKLVPNAEARNFVKKLDFMFVELTNLDSRHAPFGIEKYDALKVRSQYLEKLYAVCQNFGGETNRSDVPTGVLPSDLPESFNANGEFDPVPEN